MNQPNWPVWSQKETQKALEGLRIIREHGFRAGGQMLPREVFYAWLETFYGIAIEVVILDPKGEKVFLIKRPEDDPYFPALWHTSGVILLPKENVADAAKRVVQKEIGLTVGENRLKLLNWFEGTNSDRGHEPQMLHLLKLTDEESSSLVEKEDRKWFPLTALPVLVKSHYPLLLSVMGKP